VSEASDDEADAVCPPVSGASRAAQPLSRPGRVQVTGRVRLGFVLEGSRDSIFRRLSLDWIAEPARAGATSWFEVAPIRVRSARAVRGAPRRDWRAVKP
jgi:hypothetical protein